MKYIMVSSPAKSQGLFTRREAMKRFEISTGTEEVITRKMIDKGYKAEVLDSEHWTRK